MMSEKAAVVIAAAAGVTIPFDGDNDDDWIFAARLRLFRWTFGLWVGRLLWEAGKWRSGSWACVFLNLILSLFSCMYARFFNSRNFDSGCVLCYIHDSSFFYDYLFVYFKKKKKCIFDNAV